MNLIQMKYIVKVSQCGSITQAANELFISQPSLSQQIIKLEEELDIKLFVRKHHKLILTAPGKVFISRAISILEQVDNLSYEMLQYNSPTHAESISIGGMWTWPYLGTHERLLEYKKNNPNIEVNFIYDGSIPLLKMFKKREIDCCIIHVPEHEKKNNDFIIYPIINDYVVAAVNKKHPLINKKKVTFNDISVYDIVLPDEDSTLHETVKKGFESINVSPRIAAVSTQSHVTFQLVSDNTGIGFVADKTAKYFQNDKFVGIPIHPLIKRDISLLVHSDSINNPIIKKFIESIISKND